LNANISASPVVAAGSVAFGNHLPISIIAGPCQLESRAHALEVASALKEIAGRLKIGLVYKTSFDKANRTSASAARGIGLAQALALLPGISRSGITMVAGLARGLDHEDSARFSFLLATPIILAAGLYKLPDLLGPNGDGVRLQILAGSIAAGLAAYVSVRFLTRYFRLGTLTPFAIYCLTVGILGVVRFA
jgi:undecaprenyl pyrophosphate phosphatase UppP